MKSLRFIRITVGIAAALLLAVIALTVIVDPLFQYHLPFFGLKPVITNERYQNAGIAKRFDYEAVVIGNSIAETTVVSEVADIFHMKTVKLSSAGSHILDWTYLMEILEGRMEQPKLILIHLDPLLLAASTTELKHEMPLYLYDNDLVNDVSYWFNWSIHEEFTYGLLKRNRQNRIPDYENSVGYPARARSVVLNKIHRKDVCDLSASDAETVRIAMENMEMLMPYIDRMTGTQFVFCFSPFSCVFWDDYIRKNTIGAWQTVYERIAKELLSRGNCRLYLFQDEGMKAWMEELEHYADCFHFDRYVSKGILDRIKEDSGLLTVENASEQIGVYFDYIRSLDLDAMYFSA